MDEGSLWLIRLLLMLSICGAIAAAVGSSRGHSPFVAFLFGLLLGPLGIAAVVLVRPTPEQLRRHNTTLANERASTPNPSAVGVADEIGKLVTLRDSGALTEEEFTAQKARVLGND